MCPDAHAPVPDLGDVGLTVGVSLAATRWSLLTDEQLVAWASLWSSVRLEDDRPRVEYEVAGADEARRSAKLFDRSPKDGFCVALALHQRDDLASERVRSFLESVTD